MVLYMDSHRYTKERKLNFGKKKKKKEYISSNIYIYIYIAKENVQET